MSGRKEMGMGYYPIFVDMAGRPCLVIGGGAVAERKVEGILEAGGRVTVISPLVTQTLAELASAGKLRYIARSYRPGDLKGYDLGFVTTDDARVNADIAKEGRERGVWVNVADAPAHCDFILPSILRRGELTIAVSTGGISPALCTAIKEELEAYFSEDYATLVEAAGEIRRELMSHSRSPLPEEWRRALTGEIRRLVRTGSREQVRYHLLERLGVVP
jgi:siroheme synthase-like protein